VRGPGEKWEATAKLERRGLDRGRHKVESKSLKRWTRWVGKSAVGREGKKVRIGGGESGKLGKNKVLERINVTLNMPTSDLP